MVPSIHVGLRGAVGWLPRRASKSSSQGLGRAAGVPPQRLRGASGGPPQALCQSLRRGFREGPPPPEDLPPEGLRS
eukprot:7904365-Alexandrium_andersonii.AAC.1